MPSKSKKQQRFMGMIHAFQKGDLKNASPSVKKASKRIDPEDAKHFASTKHKGLPEKVKNEKMKNESIITFSEYLNEEIGITLRRKIEVPEKDIIEVIEAVENWLSKNPNRDSLTAGIFGHEDWKINRDSVEKDVRNAAESAMPYSKN